MTLTTELVLSLPVNSRDLGGIAARGGLVRSGVAIRADDLSVVTPEHAQQLVDAGLVAIIDLRSQEEVGFTGRGVFAGHSVAYHHLPLMASLGAAMSEERAFADPSEYGRDYAAMFERAAPALVTALSIIALAPGTVAFHCSAGKDRTGVLAAALLLTLGVADAEIVADYGDTAPNIDAIHERIHPVMSVLMERLGIDLDAAAQAASGDQKFDEYAMVQMLELLRERHGDPLAPLREVGLTESLIAVLRAKALAA